MTTALRTLRILAIAVAALAVTAALPTHVAAAVDGSGPLLCAIDTIMECDGTGTCQRHTAFEHPDFPPFLRVHVGQRLITDGQNSGRKTQITSVAHLDGRLILHGGENGRGWSATIAENTGRMSAGVVGDDFAFALFGACITP
jgi:hypothetical protein